MDDWENWRGWTDYQAYRKEDDTETMEFFLLRPQDTGLSVRLLIDDGGSYIEHNHPLFVYFQNGTDRSDDIIPVSVSSDPKIMIRDVPLLKISKQELSRIFKFVKTNSKLLCQAANGEIPTYDVPDYLTRIDDIEKEK